MTWNQPETSFGLEVNIDIVETENVKISCFLIVFIFGILQFSTTNEPKKIERIYKDED